MADDFTQPGSTGLSTEGVPFQNPNMPKKGLLALIPIAGPILAANSIAKWHMEQANTLRQKQLTVAAQKAQYDQLYKDSQDPNLSDQDRSNALNFSHQVLDFME